MNADSRGYEFSSDPRESAFICGSPSFELPPTFARSAALLMTKKNPAGLLIATRNQGKVREIEELLSGLPASPGVAGRDRACEK